MSNLARIASRKGFALAMDDARAVPLKPND
jgi:hypothetical protein